MVKFEKACSREQGGCRHPECPPGLHAQLARGVAVLSAAPRAAGGRGSRACSPLSAWRGSALDHLPGRGCSGVRVRGGDSPSQDTPSAMMA